jgi:hypothetical protein
MKPRRLTAAAGGARGDQSSPRQRCRSPTPMRAARRSSPAGSDRGWRYIHRSTACPTRSPASSRARRDMADLRRATATSMAPTSRSRDCRCGGSSAPDAREIDGSLWHEHGGYAPACASRAIRPRRRCQSAAAAGEYDGTAGQPALRVHRRDLVRPRRRDHRRGMVGVEIGEENGAARPPPRHFHDRQ